jgi:hypothetical protein
VLVLVAEDELQALGNRISQSVIYKLLAVPLELTLEDKEEDKSENPLCLHFKSAFLQSFLDTFQYNLMPKENDGSHLKEFLIFVFPVFRKWTMHPY